LYFLNFGIHIAILLLYLNINFKYNTNFSSNLNINFKYNTNFSSILLSRYKIRIIRWTERVECIGRKSNRFDDLREKIPWKIYT